MADEDMEALSNDPELASSVLERLGYEEFERALMAVEWSIRYRVLEEGKLPLAILQRLARADCEEFKWHLALVPGLDADTVTYLLAVGERDTRLQVLRRQQLPEAAYESIAADPDEDVRGMLACLFSTAPELLSRLAEDPEPSVRSAALSNQSTPLATVLRRGLDPDVAVRRLVVERTRPYGGQPGVAELCLQLARDEDVQVREAIASHLATPLEGRELLAEDPELSVRLAVAQAPGMPAVVLEEHSARDKSVLVRLAVLSRAAVPLSVLGSLSTDADRDVRASVADHSRTPVELLAELAVDAQASVREVVAMRPNLPERVLSLFAEEPSPVVRTRLRERASA